MADKIKTITVDPNEGVQIVRPKKKKSKRKTITVDPNEGIQIVRPKKKSQGPLAGMRRFNRGGKV